jgi:hypothetical protein
MLTALIAGSFGVVALATSAPASSVCATNGHVYLINPSSFSGTFTKFEDDAVDGPTYDFSLPADTSIGFQLGGNGLNPVSAPYWDVFDQNGAFIKRVTGNRAGSNCVSNQTFFSDSGSLNTAHIYRAVYVPGNNIVIPFRQAHFRFIFDQPPVNPDPDPDPTPTRTIDPCLALIQLPCQ